MNFEKRYRNSTILFSISLLFLITFLGVWLQSVYQDKAEELETEVSFFWLKSIKSVEKLNFLKLIVASTYGAIESSADSLKDIEKFKELIYKGFGETVPEEIYAIGDQINIQQIILKDTQYNPDVSYNADVQILIAQDNDTLSYFSSQDTLGSQILNRSDIKYDIKTSSSLIDHLSTNKEPYLKTFSLDTASVKSKLDEELFLAQLPIQYQMSMIQDSLNEEAYSKDRFITKAANGKKYRLELKHASSFILQRMWFEFLMGLLLVVVIAAAFYYVLNNLKEQNRLAIIKNDLISNITHELRTPIFTVSAALEALENFSVLDDPARTKEYLNISKNEINRLSILAEKVLRTSLLEQDALKINYELVPIAPLLQSISNSLQLQLEQENAVLEISNSDPTLSIRADKIHLTNVVYNLIDNALKYKADRPTIIRIEVLDTPSHTKIIVSDNGIGIPNVYLDQIFNKFFRVPQGNQHNVKGYGLGLYYVSNIIQQHQGKVTVSSEQGTGSQFTISLPKYSKT